MFTLAYVTSLELEAVEKYKKISYMYIRVCMYVFIVVAVVVMNFKKSAEYEYRQCFLDYRD